jgi:hypothetical protein
MDPLAGIARWVEEEDRSERSKMVENYNGWIAKGGEPATTQGGMIVARLSADEYFLLSDDHRGFESHVHPTLRPWYRKVS